MNYENTHTYKSLIYVYCIKGHQNKYKIILTFLKEGLKNE